MANTIKNTVTYSGADITAIAYVNDKKQKSPALNFKVESLENELTSQDKEIKRIQKEIKAKEYKLKEINGSIDHVKTLLNLANSNSNFENISKLKEKEGKYQNQLTLTKQEISNSRKSLDAATERRAQIEEELEDTNPDTPYFILGSLHTLSYSSFREKFAVRSLGRIQPKGYTRGPRTVAGTFVFTVFQEHELIRLIKEKTKNSLHPEATMLDQIDPFNIMLLFANEYGAYSVMHLFDVEIQAEGQEMSIDQIHTHNTLNFYAKEMIPMTDIGNTFNSYDEMISGILKNSRNNNRVSSNRSLNKTRIDQTIGLKEEDMIKMINSSRGLF